MTKEKFSVKECTKCSPDRIFKNNKCVYNNNLGFAYSVDEIVAVLNNDYYYGRVMELMQSKIWYCQGMYERTGELDYKQKEEFLKELRKELIEPEAHSRRYGEQLREWFLDVRSVL